MNSKTTKVKTSVMMEVEVQTSDETCSARETVVFKYDENDPSDAMVSFDKGGNWVRASMVNASLKAFVERFPFAFEGLEADPEKAEAPKGADQVG